MKRKLLAIAVVAILLFDVGSAMAQKKKKKKGDAPTEQAEQKDKKKDPTVEEKTESSKKIDGLFVLYQDTVKGSVQLFVKNDQLDKEFIYQSFSMGGPAQLFLNQNMIRTTWLFSIRKRFDKIEFVRSNTRYFYDEDNAISKAANVDVSEAVFYSVGVEAKNDDGYLIKVDDLFLSMKLDQVKPVPPSGLNPSQFLNLGSLKKDKSGYSKLRSYPNNTDFVVDLAFENSTPRNGGGASVTDARYISVKMQHSILEVPENDYKPRYDDPRVGYFNQQVDDMTSYSSTPYKDVINRWHLVKKDPNAEMSEPVEPIVWWIENTTPVEWRQTIMDAGNKWNEAFEAAGFQNAVVMKQMPDDAEWDPADIRYNVIRWVSSNLGYAIGPSFVNPRTGQILGSDITIDFGIMNGATRTSEIYESFNQEQAHSYMEQHTNCSIGKGLKLNYGFANAVVEAHAEVADIDELKHQFMTFLIMHEMGHTMGLNHNMKSSNMLSPEELGNQAITREKGVTGSVMDYPAANLIIKDTPVDFFTTKAGPYDSWAIEFGYRQFAEGEEEAGLTKILSRSHEPDLIFGNDADIVAPGRGVDPRVRTWDMSSDMVAYAKGQYELVNSTMGKLKDKFVKDGASYQDLRFKFNSLGGQRFGMTMGTMGYIGGIYVDRSFPEQDSGNQPMTPVSESYQKSAMNLLAKYVFAPNAFASDEELYPFVQLQRRGFNFGGGTEDVNVQGRAAGLQNTVYSFILHPTTMQRINNTTRYGNTYTIGEVVGDLVKAVFDADMGGSVNLYRQNAQTELVTRLGGVVSGDRHDNASKAAAYSALNTIKSRVRRAANTGNSQTRAHRSYLVYLIDDMMDQD